MNALLLIFVLNLISITYGAPTEQNCSMRDSEGKTSPNEKNCNSYYQCVNGTQFEMNCTAGQHYNARLQVCDDPKYANCTINGTIVPILFTIAPILQENTTETIIITDKSRNNETNLNITETSKDNETNSNITETSKNNVTNSNITETSQNNEPNSNITETFKNNETNSNVTETSKPGINKLMSKEIHINFASNSTGVPDVSTSKVIDTISTSNTTGLFNITDSIAVTSKVPDSTSSNKKSDTKPSTFKDHLLGKVIHFNKNIVTEAMKSTTDSPDDATESNESNEDDKDEKDD